MSNIVDIEFLTSYELNMLFIITKEDELLSNYEVLNSLQLKGYKYIINSDTNNVIWVGEGRELIEKYWFACTMILLEELKNNNDIEKVYTNIVNRIMITPKVFTCFIDELTSIGKITSFSKYLKFDNESNDKNAN